MTGVLDMTPANGRFTVIWVCYLADRYEPVRTVDEYSGGDMVVSHSPSDVP